MLATSVWASVSVASPRNRDRTRHPQETIAPALSQRSLYVLMRGNQEVAASASGNQERQQDGALSARAWVR
jgi:hypothetical protein